MVTWKNLRLIRTGVCLVAGALLAGCANEPPASALSLSDGSSALTLRCDDDWARCYSAASKACGGRGYEELDRVSDAFLSSAGRLRDRVFTDGGRENQVYDESVHSSAMHRVLTIRCKSP